MSFSPFKTQFAVFFFAIVFAIVFASTLGASLFAQQKSTSNSANAPNPFALRAARNASPNADQNPRVETSALSGVPLAPKVAENGASADVVSLKSGERLVGTVEKISGLDGVSFRATGENIVRSIPSSEIERVEIPVSDEYRAGLAAFESGLRSGNSADLRRALVAFQRARQAETRRVLRETATAKIVETLSALGRDDEAANEFFVLAALDPYSAFLPSIPLCWAERSTLRGEAAPADVQAQTESAAVRFLNAKTPPNDLSNPVGRLLAASILLNSAQYRTAAISALQELSDCKPPQNADGSAFADAAPTCRTISRLAIAQRWRLALLQTPTERELGRWEKTTALLPTELRLGPTFLVARADVALKRDDAAANAFLRVALLSPSRTLAESAASGAVDAFERAGKTVDAARIRADFQTRFVE